MDQQLPNDSTRSAAITPGGNPRGAEPVVYDARPAAGPQPPPAADPAYAQQPPPYGYYQPQPIYVTQQVQIAPGYAASPPKSMAAALLLTFFFGPLGLFYVSVPAALIMIVVSIVVGVMTFGFGLLLTGAACMAWAAIATNNYNNARLGSPQYSQHSR
ncbi:MAG: hypothetical protein JWM87_810 [Candidatus Eremiobacteraeota bacterium]|nr:hypothetical protein [Candidatus Eremiobacteraeota bacterium]